MSYKGAPSLPYSKLGNVEDGTTASKAYNQNDYIIWMGDNYFAKTDILQGAEFVVDTNLTAIPDGVINGIVARVDDLSDHLANLLKESDLGTYSVKVQFGNNKQGPSQTATYRTPIPFLVRNGNYTVTINSATVNGYTTVDKSLFSATYEASGGWNFATTSDYVAGRMTTINITVEEATT